MKGMKLLSEAIFEFLSFSAPGNWSSDGCSENSYSFEGSGTRDADVTHFIGGNLICTNK